MKLHRIFSFLALAPLLLGTTSCMDIFFMGAVEESHMRGVSNLGEEGLTHNFSVSKAGKLVVENEGSGTLRGELRLNQNSQDVVTFRLVGQGEWKVKLEPGGSGSVSVFREGDAKTPVTITVTEGSLAD